MSPATAAGVWLACILLLQYSLPHVMLVRFVERTSAENAIQAICCSCLTLAPVLLVLTPVIMVLPFFVCLWAPLNGGFGTWPHPLLLVSLFHHLVQP